MCFIEAKSNKGLTVGGANLSALTQDYALLKVFFNESRLIFRAKCRHSVGSIPGREVRVP
jgi:hypothetical protein